MIEAQPKAVGWAAQSIGEIQSGKHRSRSREDLAQLALSLICMVLLAGAIYFSELDSHYWTSMRMTSAIQRTLGIGRPVENGAAGAANARKIILVAESDNSQRLIAKTTLERYGYAVSLADNAPQTVALLRQGGPRVALVLLDVQTLRKSGEEVIRKLKNIRPNVHILVAKARGEEMPNGSSAAGWIEKPFSALPLAEAVRTVLASR
jgi:CheY-like chemotaxis protein